MALKNIAKIVGEATREANPANQFLSDLQFTITREAEEESAVQSFRPSGIDSCKRNLFFRITGAPRDPGNGREANMIRIAEAGTDAHLRLQNYVMKMQENGIDCEWVDVKKWVKSRKPAGTKILKTKNKMETRCYNEIMNMYFTCDGIIRYKGIYYILEIKTEASFKWNGQTQPHMANMKQAVCYSMGLGIDKIMFLYEERDLCRPKSFVFEITEPMKEEVHAIMAEVNSYAENFGNTGMVPDKELSKCTYCRYKKECVKY